MRPRKTKRMLPQSRDEVLDCKRLPKHLIRMTGSVFFVSARQCNQSAQTRHSPQTWQLCEFCDSADDTYEPDLHPTSDHARKPVPAVVCVFSVANTDAAHISASTAYDGPGVDSIAEPSLDGQFGYRCNQCYQRFMRKLLLMEHPQKELAFCVRLA